MKQWIAQMTAIVPGFGEMHGERKIEAGTGPNAFSKTMEEIKAASPGVEVTHLQVIDPDTVSSTSKRDTFDVAVGGTIGGNLVVSADNQSIAAHTVKGHVTMPASGIRISPDM